MLTMLGKAERCVRLGAFGPQKISERGAELRCRSSNNGSGFNGRSHSMDNQQTVEMHIASTDTYEDFSAVNGNGLHRRNSVHVTPPRNVAPQQLERHTTYPAGLSPTDRSELKAMKAELSLINAELRTKSTELVSSEKNLRAREAEVSLLRAALTGRDISIRDAKLEIAEAQAILQDKDAELQNAFQQLMANAKERGSLRHRLLAIQNELSETRKELEDWTQKGFELNNTQVSDPKEEEPMTQQAPFGKAAAAQKLPEQDQISKLLQSLSRLSQTIADDAFADEQAVEQFSQ